jgi:hypothetical protein
MHRALLPTVLSRTKSHTRLWSSGMRRCVLLWIGTTASEGFIASIFMTENTGRLRKQVLIFNWYSGGWSPIGSTRHCGHQWPTVPAPGDYDDGEIGGMIGRGNRSAPRKPVPVPLCPPQTPHAARTPSTKLHSACSQPPRTLKLPIMHFLK